MENIVIPLNISSEVMISLNESEQELKNYFQIGIAIMLFQEGKLTFGKAVELSGLGRYDFEQKLLSKNIPIATPNINEVFSDVDKLSKV